MGAQSRSMALRPGPAVAYDKRDGVCTDRLASPDGVQSFATLRLHAHLLRHHTECSSEFPPHSSHVGAQLGALESDRRIDIHNPVAGVFDALTHAAHEAKARSL